MLRDVVVSTSRDEQDADSLLMTVDVIDAKQMEEEQIGDIRELAAKLPNVTVPRSPARFTLTSGSTGRDQNSGFNIRGFEGNRVLMLVDGVRLPRNYTFSANFLRLLQGPPICARQGPRAGGLSAAGAVPQQAQLNWPVPD